MQENAPDFGVILEVLAKHEVDYIVVGGVCAVLLGAPVTTFDLDIVHSRSARNIEHLNAALEELEASYREHLPRKMIPDAKALQKTGHHLLLTRYGPLDILGAIGDNDGYEHLISHCETIDLGQDRIIRILDLETLIRMKEKSARDKDQGMLNILRAMQSM
jgi:hypothetical protein